MLQSIPLGHLLGFVPWKADISLYLDLPGLVIYFYLKANTTKPLASLFLWVNIDTLCHIDLYTEQRLQVQAPNLKLLTKNRSQDQ